MNIVNFKYTKILSEITAKGKVGKVSLNHEIKVLDVRKSQIPPVKPSEKLIEIDIAYTIVYSNLGKVELEGNILYLDAEQVIEEIEKEWMKIKKLPSTINQMINTFAYRKMISKAYFLADELGLPTPLPLPKISFNEPKKTEEKNKK